MTPEEKNALLQFMGMTYGHSHKLDKHIVGNSQFVKPISTTVKQVFEQVLKSDTTTNSSFVQEYPTQSESINTPPPPVTHVENVSIPVNKPIEPLIQVTHGAGDYHERIYLELKRIGDILETLIKTSDNVKPRKKIKSTI